MAPPIDADDLPAKHAKGDEIIGCAHDALNKLRRAEKRGTGCRLTVDEVFALSITRFGELWSQPDPRAAQLDGGQGEGEKA